MTLEEGEEFEIAGTMVGQGRRLRRSDERGRFIRDEDEDFLFDEEEIGR